MTPEKQNFMDRFKKKGPEEEKEKEEEKEPTTPEEDTNEEEEEDQVPATEGGPKENPFGPGDLHHYDPDSEEGELDEEEGETEEGVDPNEEEPEDQEGQHEDSSDDPQPDEQGGDLPEGLQDGDSAEEVSAETEKDSEEEAEKIDQLTDAPEKDIERMRRGGQDESPKEGEEDGGQSEKGRGRGEMVQPEDDEDRYDQPKVYTGNSLSEIDMGGPQDPGLSEGGDRYGNYPKEDSRDKVASFLQKVAQIESFSPHVEGTLPRIDIF